MPTNCFHCNEPIPLNTKFEIVIDDQVRTMCCRGCLGVAEAILNAGLSHYYDYRTQPGVKQSSLVPEALNLYSAYDLEEIQQDFVYKSQQLDTVSLSIEGITCAACSWLIEHKLQQLAGVTSVRVNSTTQRALISWDKNVVKLSEILNQISLIGYQASPYQVDEQETKTKNEGRRFLLRLGLAGFATMQVMMFAFALYAGYFTDLETEYRDYFRWISMIFAAPVVFYSAQPFYFSATRALLSGKINMDVSVSLAILGAYVASCIATINGTGEVYFESVSMFTFFLLLGRYFEQNARNTASVSASNLHKLVPLTAHVLGENTITDSPAKTLKLKDKIIVYPGETIAADGIIIKGKTAIDEAMLTGEQMPITKQQQDNVFAGTINLDQTITIEVTAVGQNQLVAEIIRLQEIASNNRPAIAEYTDVLGHYFSTLVIIIAALTYVVWYFIEPANAFWITLSVLVATCPCALALATPTAITCATAQFTQLGIIIRKNGVFETLPNVDHVVFDKTGTLTCGKFTITNIKCSNHDSESRLLVLASALESESTHPIAKAFSGYFNAEIIVSNRQQTVGKGIQGSIQGKLYKIGSLNFVTKNPAKKAIANTRLLTNQKIWLSCDNEIIASFELQDSLRPDSKQTIDNLKQSGINVSIASGDSSDQVSLLAQDLGIQNVRQGLMPKDKLSFIEALQNQKKTVVMFGDGINDAPVLAGANLSIAMESGTSVAKNSADMILLGDHLNQFHKALKIAKKTKAIIYQNLIWAVAYNLIILPLAVTGYVVPYIAALGMSASSLIVVSNSLRLLRRNQ